MALSHAAPAADPDEPQAPATPPASASQPSGGTHSGEDDLPRSELQQELRRLRRQLRAQERRATTLQKELDAVSGTSWGRRLVVLNVAFSFVAGAVFVAADSYWATAPFAAGCLYVVGGLFLLLSIPALEASRRAAVGARLWRPVKTGMRTLALRCAGWFTFALSLICVLSAVLVAGDAVGLLTSGGVLGILSQVLLASSVLTLIPRMQGSAAENVDDSDGALSATTDSPRSMSFSSADDPLLLSPVGSPDQSPRRALSPRAEALRQERREQREGNIYQFLAVNTLVVVLATCLALAAERTSVFAGTGSLVPAVTSCIVTVAAILLTHGLGGHMAHRNSGWSFFTCWRGQSGGFIGLQLGTWLLFFVSFLCQMAFVGAILFLGLRLTTGLMYIGGMTALASEVLLVLSIRYYRKARSQERKANDPGMQRADSSLVTLPRQPIYVLMMMFAIFNTQFIPFADLCFVHMLPYLVPARWTEALATVLYRPQIGEEQCEGCVPPLEAFTYFCYLSACVVIWFCSLPALRIIRLPLPLKVLLQAPVVVLACVYYHRDHPLFKALCLQTAVWVVYIMLTYNRSAARGGREWPWLQRQPWLVESVRGYFGGRVLASQKLRDLAAEGKGPMAPSEETPQYMAGFHPHGIMPITLVWVGLCKEWAELFPKLRVTPMVASVMHLVPAMRDLAQFLGLREVSRSVVNHTLAQGRSPIIVVGGQSEMFESRSYDKRIRIVRYHRGFFKVALQRGVPLLPTFSFGETKTMSLLEVPSVQRWFKQRIGFPLPYVPYGRWGLPMPRRRPVTVAVGAPVHVEKIANPTPEQTEELSRRYYEAVQELFDEFKERCGHGDHSIVFLDHR
eukprot:TRINITY_DN12637_c0_g1_i1.p1 TRINITY_DN12637_c0_g1~~TRINITY_DN12637_c0_g1_i1.p1  ORF type:complete len:883 (+),score=283.68 TRINITY_DN12637_c0_g1_i1:98-2650(+)